MIYICCLGTHVIVKPDGNFASRVSEYLCTQSKTGFYQALQTACRERERHLRQDAGVSANRTFLLRELLSEKRWEMACSYLVQYITEKIYMCMAMDIYTYAGTKLFGYVSCMVCECMHT